MELTHFSLFSGIGGFDLAAEWAGFRTISLVEKNPYRQRVLRKYWPDVPLWEDIRDVTEDSLKDAGILAYTKQQRPIQCTGGGDEEQTRHRSRLPQGGSKDGQYGGNATIQPVTLVTGGFPCQSFSVAGKRRGKADDRYLWPEMFRVIRLVRPHWVVGENVDGIVRMALDTVLSDLEGEGYSARAFIIPACGANAPHRRYRVWIVAWDTKSHRGNQDGTLQERSHTLAGGIRGDVSDTSIIQGRSEHKDMERRQARVEIGGGSPAVPDPQLAEVRDGRVAGRASDKGGRTAEAGREALRTREEAPQPSDPGQGGEALADTKSREPREQKARDGREGVERRSEDVADPEGEGLAFRVSYARGSEEGVAGPQQGDWWAVEPDVGRVAHGVPHRVDRLAALGDAIVPQVAYKILKAIAEIERAMWTR